MFWNPQVIGDTSLGIRIHISPICSECDSNEMVRSRLKDSDGENWFLILALPEMTLRK